MMAGFRVAFLVILLIQVVQSSNRFSLVILQWDTTTEANHLLCAWSLSWLSTARLPVLTPTTYSQYPKNAKTYPLTTMSQNKNCTTNHAGNIRQSIVFFKSQSPNDCPFKEIFITMEKLQPAVVMQTVHNVSIAQLTKRFTLQDSLAPSNHTVYLLLTPKQWKEAMTRFNQSNEPTSISMFLYVNVSLFDLEQVIILLLAFITITTGSILSANLRHTLLQLATPLPRQKQKDVLSSAPDTTITLTKSSPTTQPSAQLIKQTTSLVGSASTTADKLDFPNELSSESTFPERPSSMFNSRRTISFDVSCNTNILVLFLIMMCINILSLFYFVEYLQRFITYAVVVSSTMAMMTLMNLIVCFMPESDILIWNPIFPCFSKYLEPRHIACIVVPIAISATWIFIQDMYLGVVLQDILGMSFAIMILRCLHAPNLFVLTGTLCIMFAFDIFMVFLTPLIQTGQSVMETVALRAQHLPLLLRVPGVLGADLRSCGLSTDRILGFGDILLPGFLVSYVRSFDMYNNYKRSYFAYVLCAYMIALTAAGISATYFETGQPALLYLVPAILITTMALAWYNDDIQELWNGDFAKYKETSRLVAKRTFSKRTLLYDQVSPLNVITLPIPLSTKEYQDKTVHPINWNG